MPKTQPVQEPLIRPLSSLLLAIATLASLKLAIAQPTPPTEPWTGYDLTRPVEARPNELPPLESQPPPEPGSSSETRQGYDCLRQAAQPLPVALNPGRALPLTLSGHPTFFWYMPQVSEGYLDFTLAQPIDNSLEREAIVHHVRLEIPPAIAQQPAVMGYSLPPEQLDALAYQQLYLWSVVLACRAPGEINHDLSDGLLISGWVERLHPEDPIAQRVSDATPDQVERFSKAGIWHEALTGMAWQRLEHPQAPQAQANWQALLRSVGWERFAELPIVLYNDGVEPTSPE